MNKVIILAILGVGISCFSQIFLKSSANDNHKNILKEYLNYKVIGGYFLFIVAICCSMIALKFGLELKNIPILESLSYLLIPLLARLFLKEKVKKEKIFGIIIVILGIIIFYL